MCGPCAQIWYRPSYQQALDALSNETLQQIRTAYWEHGTLWRVVAALTKAKVESLRKWDEGLVSMAITKADELGIRPAIAVRKPKPWNRKRRFAKR